MDSLELTVYTMLFITLTGTLIYFKTLQKAHGMQIKKLQVIMAFSFGLLALTVTAMRDFSNKIVHSLENDSRSEPLPQFPADEL